MDSRGFPLLPLLRIVSAVARLCGFQRFFYDAAQHRFVPLSSRNHSSQLYLGRLLLLLNLGGALAALALRPTKEWLHAALNRVAAGACRLAEPWQLRGDCAVAAALLLGNAYSALQRDRIVAAANAMRRLHNALPGPEPRCPWPHLLLAALLVARSFVLAAAALAKLMLQRDCVEISRMPWFASEGLVPLLLVAPTLVHELHSPLQLLVASLLRCYQRQLLTSLYDMAPRQRTQLLQLWLPLVPHLQMLQQLLARVFGMHLLLRALALLHRFGLLVHVLRYDETSLDTKSSEDEDDDDDDNDNDEEVVHGKWSQRLLLLLLKPNGDRAALLLWAVLQLAGHALPLVAAIVGVWGCRRAQEQLHQMLLRFGSIEIERLNMVHEEKNSQPLSLPDGGADDVDAAVRPENTIVDAMLHHDGVIALSPPKESFLQLGRLEVPLKSFQRLLLLVLSSTVLLLVFDRVQLQQIKQLEGRPKDTRQ